jgi:hypothetical protein
MYYSIQCSCKVVISRQTAATELTKRESCYRVHIAAVRGDNNAQSVSNAYYRCSLIAASAACTAGTASTAALQNVHTVHAVSYEDHSSIKYR